MKGDYENAEKLLEDILVVAQYFMHNLKDLNSLKAVYYYTCAMNKLEKHEMAMHYVNLLFDNEIASQINYTFKQKENILVKHYNIKHEDYVENDDAYYLPYMNTLRELQSQNIIDQKQLKKVFE